MVSGHVNQSMTAAELWRRRRVRNFLVALALAALVAAGFIGTLFQFSRL